MTEDNNARVQDLLAILDKQDDIIRLAEAHYATTLAELQKICPHTTILEAPAEYLRYFADLTPLRICEACGLEEEGRGYRVLTGRAYSVGRSGPDGIYARRRRGPRHLVGKV